ncbi:YbjN domain-containing protein [Moraxella nasovis]|uniref:YbjN domain-containing protein n=1 Tax=Moraxella nasovis TaxID=2904121 RepID=UPI001F6113B6|nr:YbjN domain-containing protein [Moraxella nasovis]UNU73698.1 YbjN domain-containing protein [Moraxella nasovis]
MNLFKKLRQLFQSSPSDMPKDDVSNHQNTPSDTTNPNHLADFWLNQKTINDQKDFYLQPITTVIKQVLDEQDLYYEHRPPKADESRIHHLILSFGDDDGDDLACVFRINETNQLVSIFGILDEIVPQSYFAAAMAKIAYVNNSLGFGSIELDPNDGEVRVKIFMDAEFTIINTHSVMSHMHGVLGLTKIAKQLIDDVLTNDLYGYDLRPYLRLDGDDGNNADDTDQFTPTSTVQ